MPNKSERIEQLLEISEKNKNKETQVDAKHVFIDIVGYTHNRTIEAQTDIVSTLNIVVRNAVKKVKLADENLIFIPTGDGMCISIIDHHSKVDIHLKLALAILDGIAKKNKIETNEMRKFQIRIGINENHDNLIIDINGRANISGKGINFAARLESLGDESQIIIGDSVHERLSQREKYLNKFKHFTTSVKHGTIINAYQYIDEQYQYLNTNTPSHFDNNFEVHIELEQAYYMALCLKHSKFIKDELESKENRIPPTAELVVIVDHLADHYHFPHLMKDYRLEKIEIKKVYKDLIKNEYTLISRTAYLIDESFEHLKHLFDFSVTESILFVNSEGERLIRDEYTEVCQAIGV